MFRKYLWRELLSCNWKYDSNDWHVVPQSFSYIVFTLSFVPYLQLLPSGLFSIYGVVSSALRYLDKYESINMDFYYNIL